MNICEYTKRIEEKKIAFSDQAKEEIAQMKDDVVLLNFARDLLVDEEAVCEALKAGKMKKYVTDFAILPLQMHQILW